MGVCRTAYDRTAAVPEIIGGSVENCLIKAEAVAKEAEKTVPEKMIGRRNCPMGIQGRQFMPVFPCGCLRLLDKNGAPEGISAE